MGDEFLCDRGCAAQSVPISARHIPGPATTLEARAAIPAHQAARGFLCWRHVRLRKGLAREARCPEQVVLVIGPPRGATGGCGTWVVSKPIMPYGNRRQFARRRE